LAAGGREKCANLVEKTARMLCDFLNENKWRYWYFDGAKPHPLGRVKNAASFGRLRTLSLSKCSINPEPPAWARAEGKPRALDREKSTGKVEGLIFYRN
jgi:hypothetical protein